MAVDSEPSRALNIRDVAREAGVSYQTVSRVLNGSDRIRETTRAHVQSVIDRLGYRPNPVARALSTNRSRTIGVLTAQSALYGPATAIAAIEFAARDAGYRLSIANLRSGETEAVRASIDDLLSHAVEAIIVIAPQQQVLGEVGEMSVDVPIVALGPSGERHSMAMDQIAGARAAVGHLADLGHEYIVHLAGPQDWTEAEARMVGYLRELDARDLRVRAPLLGDWTAQFGYEAGRSLLRMPDFTAVFAGNDSMALGFLHACRELGVRVPEDISVVGFDDIPEAAHFFPPLTTVRQDFSELGRRTIRMLLAQLNGEELPQEPLIPQLIVRSSTAAPRSL
ncbi:LacI family DNA-binding transcriptional regulator [Microbacterium azadirachtae]|uniref:LacI family DNA-binding transcriptional regulator n=1 Tax=Microbacterium azadirachtae TaxID=582680 RepID=UPI003F74EAA8